MPMHFNGNVMERHFDAAVLEVSSPNATAMSAGVCRDFCERVIASSGGGPSPLQREARSSAAIECIANTNIPVVEIGYRVGFPDPSNFRAAPFDAIIALEIT